MKQKDFLDDKKSGKRYLIIIKSMRNEKETKNRKQKKQITGYKN